MLWHIVGYGIFCKSVPATESSRIQWREAKLRCETEHVWGLFLYYVTNDWLWLYRHNTLSVVVQVVSLDQSGLHSKSTDWMCQTIYATNEVLSMCFILNLIFQAWLLASGRHCNSRIWTLARHPEWYTVCYHQWTFQDGCWKRQLPWDKKQVSCKEI
jgi:hypothetical protein